MQQYLVPALSVLFQRIQIASTPKIVRLLLVVLSVLTVRHGGTTTTTAVDSVQPGMMALVLEQLWLPNVQKVSGGGDRKLVAVAMTRLLCDTPAMITPPLAALWVRVFQALVRLFELPEEEDDYDAEDACASFASLWLYLCSLVSMWEIRHLRVLSV
jgi:exportin-2 (importin alpha re-exporter)